MRYSWNTRTELLYGTERMARLAECHVLVVGLGGVGAYAAEQLCRAGVGRMTLVDADCVNESNLNRQLPALHSTLGRPKAEVMAERLLDINPELQLTVLNEFLRDERTEELLTQGHFDYVVDAIDTVTAKIDLIMEAQKHDVPIISSMGTGNKLNPGAFEVSDIYKTSVCPLAKVMRRELKERGVKKLKVIYSKEVPRKSGVVENGKAVPGSISFVPASAGLLIASEVVKDILKI